MKNSKEYKKAIELLNKYLIKNFENEQSTVFNKHGWVESENSSARAWATRYHRKAYKILRELGFTTNQIIEIDVELREKFKTVREKLTVGEL